MTATATKLPKLTPIIKRPVWVYDTTYHTYPTSKTYPAVTGGTFIENYSYDPGTSNLLWQQDINHVGADDLKTYYTYDTFKRLISIDKPDGRSPDITYAYPDWGTINQQRIVTTTYYDATNYLWQKEYFDGLGRVIQTQANGESGHTIVSSTTTFSNRGLVDKQYVSQDISSVVDIYQAPNDSTWKRILYVYDALGRVTQQTNADGTIVSHDYSASWRDQITDPNTNLKNYYYDAFQRLIKVEELDDNYQLYSVTNYTYDILGNLIQLKDNNNNTSTMVYDWLSRKTQMIDPDMGSWVYSYDYNGNLSTQTDSKGQTITMVYDPLNRLTNKNYPAGLGMTNVVNTYDDTTGSNVGKGKRTSMSDALGANSTADKYDNRGRLVQETKTVDSLPYTTSYTYDGADRIITCVYPSGETVRPGYNGRGLPDKLGSDAFSGNNTLNLVSSALYNSLGSITEINLGNNPVVLKNTYGYYGTGGTYDTAGGYYGRLWEIKTTKQPGSSPVLQDLKYVWDRNGNLTRRTDAISAKTETFHYDFLDRLGINGVPVAPGTPGDANEDGMISQADVDYVYAAIMGLISPVNPEADANGDHTVSMADVTAIEILMGNLNPDYDSLGNISYKAGTHYIYNIYDYYGLLQTGLIGQWKLDEGSGTNAADSSGSGNNGALTNGPTWTTGVSGKAVNFDGVNDYISLSQQPSLSGGFTFSAWVRRSADQVGEIFNNNQFFLRVQPENENNSNPFEAFVKLSDGIAEPRANSGVAATVGQWFFVTVTWDGSQLKDLCQWR